MLEFITQWWNAISGFEKIFWFLALPSSILVFIQLILSFLGMDHHDVGMDVPDVDYGFSADIHDGDVNLHAHLDSDSADSSVESSSFQFFTVKGCIFFFAAFGWVGIAGVNSGWSKSATTFIALMAGLVAMLVMATIMYSLSKLSADGTMKIRNAIGSVGTVYLPIPPNRSGSGQIQLSIQGSVREISAVTDSGEKMQTGSKVKVLSLIDGHTVLVEKA